MLQNGLQNRYLKARSNYSVNLLQRAIVGCVSAESKFPISA